MGLHGLWCRRKGSAQKYKTKPSETPRTHKDGARRAGAKRVSSRRPSHLGREINYNPKHRSSKSNKLGP